MHEIVTQVNVIFFFAGQENCAQFDFFSSSLVYLVWCYIDMCNVFFRNGNMAMYQRRAQKKPN